MKKFIQNKLKEQKGLTLIELLAVIVILAIIAAIAIPAIGNIMTNSKVSALQADGQNVLAAANIYFTENGGSTITVKELKDEGFLDDVGNIDIATTGASAAKVVKSSGGNQLSAVASNDGVTVTFVNATNNDIASKDTTASATGSVRITR